MTNDTIAAIKAELEALRADHTEMKKQCDAMRELWKNAEQAARDVENRIYGLTCLIERL